MSTFDRSGLFAFASRFLRAADASFPPPNLLLPRAAGIDISDSSIKWIVFTKEHRNIRVHRFGEHPLEGGIVVRGVIADGEKLAEALGAIRKELGAISYAHSALPEEAAYVFSMHVPEGASRSEILSMIEFELDGRVPISPQAAVYDFNVIAERGSDGSEIGVVAFPRDLAESYVAAFEGGGIRLLSLEVEARSIARAVSSDAEDEPITLLVDFGRARTGFAVLNRGVPIFTSTVEVGGDAVTAAVGESLGIQGEDVERFKNEQGLLAEGEAQKKIGDSVTRVAGALADEISRHYRYWDTRRNERGERMTPVGKIILVGGSSNLKGLPDFIAAKVQAEAGIGNVWRNVDAFEDYVPPIERTASLQYATAVGLALRGLK